MEATALTTAPLPILHDQVKLTLGPIHYFVGARSIRGHGYRDGIESTEAKTLLRSDDVEE